MTPALVLTNQWRSWPPGGTSGKLMDILWRPTLRPQIKTFKTGKLLELSLFPEHACSFPPSFISESTHLSLSLSPCPPNPRALLLPLLLISCVAHFYLCDFLIKLCLTVWVLALNSFLARTEVLSLLNWGLILGPFYCQQWDIKNVSFYFMAKSYKNKI